MELDPFVILIPVELPKVALANPLEEPISNCPLERLDVFIPVPPYCLLIVVAFHVPEVSVPTVERLLAEVMLPSVPIEDSMVDLVVLSKASIFFNVAVPLASEITLDEPTVRLLPIVKPPERDKSFLMVVVPVVAPIVILVPAPPKLIVVADWFAILNVDWFVVMSPPFT